MRTLSHTHTHAHIHTLSHSHSHPNFPLIPHFFLSVDLTQVKEETGVNAESAAFVGFREKHAYTWGRDDFYYYVYLHSHTHTHPLPESHTPHPLTHSHR